MSSPVTFPKNGQYKIFNSRFTTQYVDLLYGDSFGSVVGNNEFEPVFGRPYSEVWNLEPVSYAPYENQFTFKNAAPSAAEGPYPTVDWSYVRPGMKVKGNNTAIAWTLIPACQPDQYWIMIQGEDSYGHSASLFWTLSEGQNEAPITIELMDMDQPRSDHSQLWFFKPQVPTVGNAARGLDGLD